jgi:hypothetical protein
MQQLDGRLHYSNLSSDTQLKGKPMDTSKHDNQDTDISKQEGGKGPKPRLVEVIVDRRPTKVQAGPYRVSVFKAEVGVPPEKALDQIIKGTITPLDDNDTIVIAGGEKFISHERTGAAS